MFDIKVFNKLLGDYATAYRERVVSRYEPATTWRQSALSNAYDALVHYAEKHELNQPGTLSPSAATSTLVDRMRARAPGVRHNPADELHVTDLDTFGSTSDGKA